MGPTLFHLHAGPRVGPGPPPRPPPSQDRQASAPEAAQGRTASHLTSKVGQPPNPGHWHLPLPSPLTELEGEQKEASGKSAGRDRIRLPSFVWYPRPSLHPQRQQVCPAAHSHKQRPARSQTSDHTIPGGADTSTTVRTPRRPAPGGSPTHHLLVGLAVRASLGLPGLLNVLGRKAPHRGLVLVEEPSLKAGSREGGAGVYEEPPIHPAQRRGSLAREPRFPEGPAVHVGRSWARAAAASVARGRSRRPVLERGCRDVRREVRGGSLGPRP